MNNENNNGTVLGGVNPNPVPNPIPNPQPINGTENLGNVVNGMPTPPPVNPTPVSPEPINPGPMPNTPVPPMTPTPNMEPMGEQTPLVNGGNEGGVPPMQPETPLGMPNEPVQPSIQPTPNPASMGMPIPPQPNMGSVPPVTPVGPNPAYTNPQVLNQNTIGTTPPISYEPEKKPKGKGKGNNKILFIIIIVLVLAVVGFGTFYVLKYTDLINKNTSSVTITAGNVTSEVGAELSKNIADYAVIRGTNMTNCDLNTENVDINKAGVYEYTVTCGEVHKTGKVTIVDNADLKVTLNDVFKVKGEELDAKEFAEAGSDYTYEFVDPTEAEKYISSDVGTYTIKVRVTNNSNNKTTEVDGNLIILSNPLKGYLTCSSKEQNVENSNAKMVVSERFAILDGSTVANAFGNVTYEIYNFTYADEQEYNNLLNDYNNNGTITINNVTGKTVFDDETKTITITNLRKNDEVVAEYGEENLQNYTTIKKYFSGDVATNSQGLGYECKYEKAQ